MHRFRTYLVFLIILFILTSFGIARLTAGDPGPTSSGSSFMDEIRTIRDQEAADLRKLRTELENAPDETVALAILRRITERKQNTEIAVLRVQGRRAREQGDLEAARQIDLAIQRILDPQPATPSPEALREIEARRAAERGRE